MDSYRDKYLKYKLKYINLKKYIKNEQEGGFFGLFKKKKEIMPKFKIRDRVKNKSSERTGQLHWIKINPDIPDKIIYEIFYDDGTEIEDVDEDMLELTTIPQTEIPGMDKYIFRMNKALFNKMKMQMDSR
jgi:hypothetical protein